MATFELNATAFTALASGSVQEVKEWEDGKPVGRAIDEATKLPLWKVGILLTQDGKVTEEAITVPFEGEPVFAPFTNLVFTKPMISPRTFGNAGYSLKASAVKPAETKQG